MFDSRADVAHQPIPVPVAVSIHLSASAKPPQRAGLRIMYCGLIRPSICALMSSEVMPISSSSRATGTGDKAHTRAIASGCPARMGCSMEWRPNCDSFSRRARAFSGVKAPLASARSSSTSAGKRLRIYLRSASSSSKSMPPIFSLRHRKPRSSFCCMRPNIVSRSPIQMRPLMTMPSSPDSHFEPGKIMPRPPFAKSARAVSKPMRTDDGACRHSIVRQASSRMASK